MRGLRVMEIAILRYMTANGPPEMMHEGSICDETCQDLLAAGRVSRTIDGDLETYSITKQGCEALRLLDMGINCEDDHSAKGSR